MKTRNSRVCKQCKKEFIPTRSYMPICSEECAIAWAKEVIAKKKRKDDRQAKIDYNNKSRPWLLKQAQKHFNSYIRKRDEGKPCISCGHTGNRQRHASHFRPVGRNARLRFNEFNCHSSCSICNAHLSGNLVPYREAMIGLYGLAKVEELECDNEPYKFGIEELHGIINKYKEKIKTI